MVNNEAGAFLNITPDVLNKLDSFDEKLKKIEGHAHTAADALKNGFGSVVVDTSKLESAITSLANKIGALNTASNSVGNIGTAAQGSARGVSSMNESLSRAADLTNKIWGGKFGKAEIGNLNIAQLKEGISDLKRYLENTKALTQYGQKGIVEAMRYMKMQLDYQRQTDEQRAQSAEKAAQRKEAADRRAYKAGADLAKAQNYKQNTTAQGALDFSKTANTLQRQITAIEYLKKARLSLNTTDANYKSTLNQINQAIAKHNQALTDAGIKSQQLATRHRNLMDTAGQLSRQLALVFSVSQIEGYISKLANVRGEFELQQRSLEAILQNKAQADQIFNKTVQLAVKSPFQIKELVTFTKQLAAYRIESDKLYDTTKRLADVSAGLGVDMGRLILAYGQVKAAAYLRGTEVRQFTEAGINLYGELQRYFEEVKGEAYTTAQIVDMISKRKVTFEDIENIFKRLTDSGGLFYNMQEIQAETLQGKISNLKDSIDVMLNSIGKANEDTLKGSIDSIKVLIDNWETVVEVAKAFGIVVGSMVLLPKIKAAANGVSLLSFAFTKAETALRSLGLAFKTSFPLIALGAALQLVNELWNVHSQYNKMLRESSNKYYTAQLRIGEIDEIAKNDTRKALSSLVKEMNNEGFEIEIKPNISEKEAKEQFEEYKKQYTEFLEDIRKIEANYAENRKKGWLIGNDDIETDLDEYENAFYDFIAKGNKIQAELLRISEESTSLGKGAKEYIQELVKGKKEGENLIDYYKRLADYLEKLQNGVLFAGKKSSIASSFLGTKKDLEKDKEEATKEIREIFDSVNDEVIKGNKTREQFKILIDKGDFSKQWSDIKKQLAYDIYNLGDIKVPLRPGINQEDPQSNPKHERDILAERISLIKELNKEYEKLNKVMGSDKAAKTVMERYASQLKDVQMPKNIIGEAFLPNKENTAKALQELAKIITDFRKKIGAQKDANVLFDEKDADDFKKQLDKTKDNIESMFNGLDLYNKMKKEGFSDEMIKSLFGDLTTTESEIQAEIEKLAGKEGELWEKAYDDLNKKLKSKQDEMFKNRIEQYAQFINDFNNQIENKQEEFADYMKIARDMLNKTGDVKAFTDQVGNIIAKYNQDIAKIETEKFKKSGTYIEMMGELSIKSADELQALIESLEDFIAKSASNIPADTLKIYINRLNEANEQLDKVKNPFGKSFIKGIKEITELQNKYNAEKSYQNELLQKQVELENELRDIESKRDIAKANGDDTTNFENQIVDIQDLIKDNDNSIANSSAKLQGMSTQMGKMTQGAGAVIGIIDKIVKGIDDSIQATADLFNEIKDIASSYGVDTESGGWQDLSIAMSSLSEMSTNVSNSWNSFKSGDFAGAAVSAIKSVGSVIKGINAIHDAKYERKIKRQQKNIESLQDAYEILKEKIDKAWDITSLNNATKQTTQNIDQQIRSYQEMINAEQKKKDTDDERIKEWNEAIKELQKTKEEIIKQEQMDLGGIGGESEYRDAAESFVQAWMDAFNETEDGLKALNENFNDFIENLIVKQATMRLAQARLKNLFDMIDKSVTEDSDGGISITQKELADIYAEATTSMKGLNEDLLSFVETLGYKPSKKANLSALQQGIQGITETTAEALEALLNSIRFFVSQQTTDITAIRNLLDARYSLESQAETNPMLIELKAQTGYLEIISDRIDRVFAPNSNSRGAGLRVFISD